MRAVSVAGTRGRRHDLGRGLALEGITVAWNIVEFLVAVISGFAAGSVVLLAFGFDSLIEAASGAVVFARLRRELTGLGGSELAQVEARAARTSGALLVLLATTVLIESVRRLSGSGPAPHESSAGIALTAVAAAAMPLLGVAKRRLAHRLGSGSLRIEAEQTIACAWFSLTTLAGLLLNATFGWWWADPTAALLLVPWMVYEGLGPWMPRRGDAHDRRTP